MLDQNAQEALDGAEAHAMQHDRALLGAIGIDVFQIEVLRHLEIELARATLPGASERILQVEVDLRAVEGTIALVELVIHAQLRKRCLQASLGCLPIGV